MADKKQPYIPIYTGDYIKDTRSLTLAAKGAWSDLIFFMWAQETNGVMEGTMEDFARQIGGTVEETEKVLLELCLKKICDRAPGENGAFKIICRRLVKESQISAIRSESGSKGGSKTQAKLKAKKEQKSDNDNDNDNDNIKESKKKDSHSIVNVPRETLSIEPLNEDWFNLIFDEQHLSEKAMTYREHDVPGQLLKFKSKVRGSLGDYIHRDTAGMRSAFDYQLRNTKPDKHYKNGRTTNKRSSDAVIESGRDFGTFD